jgi:CxxC-x17-CxxC domain-containing protein
MDFVDRILTCTDCGGQFIFTAGEQFFFQDKQFKNDPKRCKPCKSRRGAGANATNAGGPAAAGISRTETRTVCSECGIETTVPFKPTQGRPVLCRQCYKNKMAAAPAAEQTVPASAPAVQPVAASAPAAVTAPVAQPVATGAKLPPASSSAPIAARRQPPQPEFAASDVSLAI